MPEKFKRMKIEQPCERSGRPSEHIAYGTATNFYKQRYGITPKH